MEIKSKLLYMIEATSFSLYCKTVKYRRIERAAWCLYSKIFEWTIPRAWALDRTAYLACGYASCKEHRQPSMKVGGF